MRWIIEVEETVKFHHQIVVDIKNEDQIQDALDNAGDYCNSLDEFVDNIEKVIPVIEVNEKYSVETEQVEYYDDYEDDEY